MALWLWTAQSQDIQKNTSLELSDTLKTEKVVEKENPFTMTSGYAGSINIATVDPSNLEDFSHFNTTRVGWWVKYDLTKNLSAHTRWIIDGSNDWIYSLWQVFLKQNVSDNYSLLVWNQATPATKLRPFPVSFTWHFETSTDRLIPGGKNWVSLDKSWTFNGSAWVFLTEQWVGYWLNLWVADEEKKSTKKINAAWWWENDETFGVVISWAYRAVYVTFLPYAVQNWDAKDPERTLQKAELWVLMIGEVDMNGTPVTVVAGPWYTFRSSISSII